MAFVVMMLAVLWRAGMAMGEEALMETSEMKEGAARSVNADDYARAEKLDQWHRHPVYGDASFDAFERLSGNPIDRGAPPLTWPVNGFLFIDPPSGDFYVFVGEYAEGYAMVDRRGVNCTAWRSRDRGGSWERLGSVFPDEPFTFEGDEQRLGSAPDVAVVYEEGRYHLVYDFSTVGSTWETMFQPRDGADNGIGYAWSDRPEGPYHRVSPPVYRNSAHPNYLKKYRRGYAQTLIRRADDWLVLFMMDSGPYFGWALVGMTAPAPEGPYSTPVFLRSVEDTNFHPPLLEYYPAFTHDGYVYAPATSVALNRNFQAVFRAPIEGAHRASGWELWQYGSVWHAAPVENEYEGIWGQTYSGAVSDDGTLFAMFPSRDADNRGTINLARRPWRQPYRDGFVVSAHGGPSVTFVQRTFSELTLDAEFEVRGRAALVWGLRPVLGPDAPRSDAATDAAHLRGYMALQFGDDGTCSVVRVDDAGARTVSAKASFTPGAPVRAGVEAAADRTRVTLGDAVIYEATEGTEPGSPGWIVGPRGWVRARRFSATGSSDAGRCVYLSGEALLGAGQQAADWEFRVADAAFRFGTGVVSSVEDARAKWNVVGAGLTLYAPRGPEYGRARVTVDGAMTEEIDLHAEEPAASEIVYGALFDYGLHTLVIEPIAGRVPVDCLEVRF